MSEIFFVKIATFSFFSMNSQWIGKYDALLESSIHFQLIAVPGKKKYLMLMWISKTDQCSSWDARMAIGCQKWWQIDQNLKKIFLIGGWSEAEGFYLKIVPNCLIYGQSSADLCTLESGINVPPWINIAPGTFGKNNKHSPLLNSRLFESFIHIQRKRKLKSLKKFFKHQK